jgi:hypothetical protein
LPKASAPAFSAWFTGSGRYSWKTLPCLPIHKAAASRYHAAQAGYVDQSIQAQRTFTEGGFMLRKLMVVAALALLPAMAAHAQFQAGDYELSLSGSGANGPDFDGTHFSAAGNLGYFLSKELEVGVRQSFGYADDQGPGSQWFGTTRFALDYHFDLGRVQPYIGGNIGYQYGDIHNTFEAAPEAGVKFFVNSTTFIQLGVEYQFFFDKDSDTTSAISDGQFVYGLGIGFRWH